MATTDKHPPLDPRRHSTNKRVKPTAKPSFGTAVKTAKGSKTIKAGDKGGTSAKRETPSKSQAEKNAAASILGERNTEEKRKKLYARGYMTHNETLVLKKMKKTRKPVI